jgi:WD40 repeat protein
VSKDKHNGESFRCLSGNPLNNEYICSGGVINSS